mmetsp:Transcript_18705/g.24097  ORF Transcript_18705/g.24097 Transcript_18705/m.24097 type:complete len:191 (+) Transcript_18705:280-852(+)
MVVCQSKSFELTQPTPSFNSSSSNETQHLVEQNPSLGENTHRHFPRPSAKDAAIRRKIRLEKLKLLREKNNSNKTSYVVKNETDCLPLETSIVSSNTSKKQQRMIRNRESAALSRKRKRDRIYFLEAENKRLKEQNEELQRKIEKYEAASSIVSVSHQAHNLPRNKLSSIPRHGRFNPESAAFENPPLCG